MIHLLQQHPLWSEIGAYWLFSAIVSGMPVPKADGNQGYLWLYNVLHTLAGNVMTAFGSKIPGAVAKIAPTLVLLIVLGTTAACHAGYTVHPGSINTFDSITADTLTGVKLTIDGARPKLQNGGLPATLKPAFSSLVNAYNLAHDSYNSWRDIMKAGVATPDQAAQQVAQLNNDMAVLARALAAYTQAGGK